MLPQDAPMEKSLKRKSDSVVSRRVHKRSATRVDDKLYHPICFNDFKSPLMLDSAEVERIIFDDDDDVIILPQEEPIIIEIPDDDDALGIFTSSPNETNATYEPIENESDLQILVPRIPVVYVEDFKEKPIDTATDVEKSLKSSVKIRDEPKADGYEDDGFEDIGTFEDATIIEDNRVDANIPHATITSTKSHLQTATIHQMQTSLHTSVDGNVQWAPVTTIGTNKIKINIKNSLKKNVSDKRTKAPLKKEAREYLQEKDKEEEITFEYKTTMKEANFKKMAVNKYGLETSGLCNIM